MVQNTILHSFLRLCHCTWTFLSMLQNTFYREVFVCQSCVLFVPIFVNSKYMKTIETGKLFDRISKKLRKYIFPYLCLSCHMRVGCKWIDKIYFFLVCHVHDMKADHKMNQVWTLGWWDKIWVEQSFLFNYFYVQLFNLIESQKWQIN